MSHAPEWARTEPLPVYIVQIHPLTTRAKRRMGGKPKRPSQGVTKPRDGSWIPPVDPIAFEPRNVRRLAQKARRAARKRGGAVIDWTPLSAW